MDLDVPEVLAKIKYRDWTFLCKECTVDDKTCWRIHGFSPATDAVTNESTTLYSASLLLPKFPPEATVLEYAMLLIAGVEEHERKEFFIYDGKRIFDPHIIPGISSPE